MRDPGNEVGVAMHCGDCPMCQYVTAECGPGEFHRPASVDYFVRFSHLNLRI